MNLYQGIGIGIVSGYIIASILFFYFQRKLRREINDLICKNDILMIIARAYDKAVTEAQKNYDGRSN